MPKKNPSIKYTSRDFSTIRNDLIDYVKRYYSDTYRDFNEASFGALMLDTVAYVGDILSFYLDYQANESFLNTAVEYDNILRLGRAMGYKQRGNPSTYGVVTCFVMVPALSGAPDTTYMPVLQRGSQFSTRNGNVFTLIDDIHFGSSENEVVVARVNTTTGLPTYFAVRAEGRVVSGELERETVSVGEFERFLRIKLAAPNVTEVLSVVDSEGHDYYEVDHLSQNVVYKEVVNRVSDSNLVKSILKPVSVARRYTVEQERDVAYLQFGYGSDSEISSDSIADPSEVVLDIHGRDYIQDSSFDPTKLISSDKFGVAPSETTLTIAYRTNTSTNCNAAVNSLVNAVRPAFAFDNAADLNVETMQFVADSLEATNEKPIVGDVSMPTSEELRRRVMDVYAAQNRAVSKQDYISMAYQMPSNFGSIKRCNIVQDRDSLRRNLNLYVVSEDASGNLTLANNTIKTNLKNWLSKNKMINDTVDILDPKILNFGIEFEAVAEANVNRFELLSRVIQRIKEKYQIVADMGESFYITDVYNIVNDVEGVIDASNVKITNLVGGSYSNSSISINRHKSADGRQIIVPEDSIWEIKYPDSDIKGVIK